jgi:PadR family transcriptional regulator, regulatory protein PadR
MSTKEQADRIALRQCTLELLMLRTVLLRPTQGHPIANAIEFNSEDVLQVEQGSLRATFCGLTAKGRRQLVAETSKWDKLAGAITRILRPAESGAEPGSKP